MPDPDPDPDPNSAGVRLGLIGAGPWGRNYIATIGRAKGVSLERMASRNAEARALAGQGCTVSHDWRAVAEASDIDGVIIATPPPSHAAIARAALAAGRAVLVEKPLTQDLSEARALGQLAARVKACVLVDHIHLFSPAFVALKSRVLALPGPLTLVGEAGSMGPFRAETPVLWDWGAHDVAMCLALTGSMPRSVSARALERRTVEGELGEIVALELAFDEGTRAAITVGNLMQRKTRRFSVEAGDTKLVYDDLAEAKLVVDEGHGSKPVAHGAEKPLDAVVAAFTAAIGEHSRDRRGLELGIQVTEVLARCQTSLEAGGSPA